MKETLINFRNKDKPDPDIQDMIDAVAEGEPFETWSTGDGTPKNNPKDA